MGLLLRFLLGLFLSGLLRGLGRSPLILGRQGADPADGVLEPVRQGLLLRVPGHQGQLCNGILDQCLGIGLLVFQGLHCLQRLEELVFPGVLLSLPALFFRVLHGLFLCLGRIDGFLLFIKGNGV